MDRRVFVLGLLTLAGVPGCLDAGSGSRPNAVADSGPGSYLPESRENWEFLGMRDHPGGWSPLGADDGAIGQYRGPDGNAYEFVVMDTKSEYSEGTARSLACAGWQVALEVDGNAVAASTGTDQRQFTPEAPPQMTQSTVPDTDGQVRELLALSPRLDESDVEENQIGCER